MELPERRPNRLKGYDYGVGAYFVTICTYDRKCILSDIHVGEGLAPPVEIKLTPYGKVAEEQLLDLQRRYSSVQISKYVIMPNHIHAIIQIWDNREEAGGASPSPTLMDVIRVFKSMTPRLCGKMKPGEKIFQRSFHDHVIRNENDWREIWEYIEPNPRSWMQDEFYIS